MRVLHALSQRPSLTGSGVTLDALVRHADASGWQQLVVVGTPAEDPTPAVGGLRADRVRPLLFGTPELPFPVPGMSDVMPYPSTRFSVMSAGEVSAYRNAWRRHLATAVADFRPDLIHTHHVWVMSAVLKDVAPSVPVVTHCHATGLRQMMLCPGLGDEVRRGCARHEAFLVLHRGHASELARAMNLPDDRIHAVGAGYREGLFHPRGREPGSPPVLLYIGKYSNAKGLPWLLDAVERLVARRPELSLHVAGDGSGPEAEALRARMAALEPRVVRHGQLSQAELAKLMRRSTVCVLPSFFEGLPLVLVEAMACGCRLVATSLPGIARELAPRLGAALELVDPPALTGVDTPVAAELPAFVRRLEAALDRALDGPPPDDPVSTLKPFTWRAVFKRVETVWRSVAGLH